MDRYKKMRYEAIEMGKYILEDHNYIETAEEFGTSIDTVKRRINLLEGIRPKLYLDIISKYPNRAKKS